jgi:hypothetical protein
MKLGLFSGGRSLSYRCLEPKTILGANKVGAVTAIHAELLVSLGIGEINKA